MSYFVIPAFVFHGVVPCVAITSSVYPLASAEIFKSSINDPNDERIATQRCTNGVTEAGITNQIIIVPDQIKMTGYDKEK
jgi:hypothetical protein